MGKREEAKSKRRRGCLIPAVLIAALMLWVPAELYLSNNVLKTEEVTVHSARLPASFDGFRILHLSDLHEKTFGTGNQELIRKAEEAVPDIIAITGDMLDTEGGLAYAQQLLPKLTAIAPVYYVTGNHEWAADGKTAHLGSGRLISRLEQAVTDSGAVWLDSTYIELGCCQFPRLNCKLLSVSHQPIILAGLCDPLNRAAPDIRTLRQMVADRHGGEHFSVLLSHRHDLDYTGSGFDVVLAGHAHGGVVRIPFTDGLIGPAREWFPKDTSGVLSRGGTQTAVSRGLGDTYAPRFLNRPHMPVVVLKQ
jgi:hypothetical protein